LKGLREIEKAPSISPRRGRVRENEASLPNPVQRRGNKRATIKNRDLKNVV
jgi:hypothetical protein